MKRKGINLTKISLVIGILIAIPALTWPTGIITAGMEHFELVAANTTYIRTARFVKLDQLKFQLGKQGKKIPHTSWVAWCNLGKQLGYWKVCPPK